MNPIIAEIFLYTLDSRLPLISYSRRSINEKNVIKYIKYIKYNV